MNNKNDRKLIAYCMYVLALLIFATNGVLVSYISLESSQIVFLRTLIGGFILTCIVLLFGGFDVNNVSRERVLLILGGTVLGLNWVALFEAYRQLNVSLSTLIYYVGPILVLLFSPVLFREKLTGRKITACIFVAIGLVCISGSIVMTGMRSLGLLAAVLSAVLYAAVIIVNKQISLTNGLQTAAIELDVAALVTFIYMMATTGMPHMTSGDIPYILAIGIINTGLAYLLYFTSLQKLPGQSVALISYLDPVAALFFSALLLHEIMTPVQIFGALLIIGGAMFGEMKSR